MMDDLSEIHAAPLNKWIEEGAIFKFWGDNLDMKKNVRDLRANNQGDMVHMFSMVVGRSRITAHQGQVSSLDEASPDDFLPTHLDIELCKSALVKIVCRTLTKHIAGLTKFSKVVPKHILYRYSREMALKSDVFPLDALMNNECEHRDMVDILQAYHDYLGEGFDETRKVRSGGDYLTVERQRGAQLSRACGATVKERLGVLEPVAEDWHCLGIFLTVSCWCTIIRMSLLPALISRLHGSICLVSTPEIVGH